MALKSRGPIAINPGAKKILKKKRFSMNKGLIAKCHNFRGQIEISQESTITFALLGCYSIIQS